MNQFTIYCTPEQTQKALELGAPIVLSEKRDVYNDYPQEIPGKIGKYFTFEEAYSCCFCNNYGAYKIPTAEQIIGWLYEQEKFSNICVRKTMGGNYSSSCYCESETLLHKTFSSRQEATIAALMAAMEYLTNNKK